MRINVPSRAMEWGALTAQFFLEKAVSAIDKEFKQTGYAAAHPELVIAFMQIAASDEQHGALPGKWEGIE